MQICLRHKSIVDFAFFQSPPLGPGPGVPGPGPGPRALALGPGPGDPGPGPGPRALALGPGPRDPGPGSGTRGPGPWVRDPGTRAQGVKTSIFLKKTSIFLRKTSVFYTPDSRRHRGGTPPGSTTRPQRKTYTTRTLRSRSREKSCHSRIRFRNTVTAQLPVAPNFSKGPL